MARPDKLDTHILPYLDDIQEMALTMTEEQIAKTLGVSLSSWKRYKSRCGLLRTALKKGRRELVKELKSALISKAKGFDYEEKKIIKELVDGKLSVTREEINMRKALPDVAAINLLLKNYDKENWANDPQMLEIRKKEIELQERKIEENIW